jgi:hypothetical protein
MSAPRSPRYPSLSLVDAIERAKLIFEKERTSPATRVVIARALGYAGISGASAVVIGSLRQYGLLIGHGESLRLSDLAVALIHAPMSSSEYLAAVRTAAQAPSLFAEIATHFGGNVPSDENLKYFLLKRAFSPEASVVAARAFKETIAFVAACEVQRNRDNADQVQSDLPSVAEGLPESAAGSKIISRPDQRGVDLGVLNPGVATTHVERTVLTPGVSVELRFDRVPTLDDFEALADYVAFRVKRLLRQTSAQDPSLPR